MAVSFDVPSGTTKNSLIVSVFKGADFTDSPAAVSNYQSPYCLNMIRDVPGKVRKRMGYYKLATKSGKINGIHKISISENNVLTDCLIHAGTNLMIGDEVVYTDMNNARSQSWRFNKKVFIADGKTLLVYDIDDKTVKKATEDAYVPLVTIGKAPNGGGTSYEAVNLIGKAFEERFLSNGTATDYYLSFANLDSTSPIVKILNDSGEWVTKTENTDFTVDRENGIIKFNTAPSVSPVTGEDNVAVTAYRTVEGYADRINKCTIGIQYGINGARDRLFLSGNPDYPNYDWYSAQNDATYFPDTAYSTIGTYNSAIMGYSIMNNYLATHKDEYEKDQCIILRKGEITDNEPTFKISGTLQGNGAISKYSFQYLDTEPLYMTRQGIHAVTTPDSGEKYSQNRSYFLNGKLLQEEGVSDACSIVYHDMYWLCFNSKVYILDGLQNMQTENEPYSTRQYAGFYLENIPAYSIMVFNNQLIFGDTSGNIYAFYTDKNSLASYKDVDTAIHAIWETPDISAQHFYKYKTFKYLAVRLAVALRTGIKISALKKGVWSLIKNDEKSAGYLKFTKLCFSRFSFSSDQTEKVIPTKMRLKKIDKVRFRFENDVFEEPFGLFDYALEYTENANTK